MLFTSDNDARLYVSVPTHKCKPSLLNLRCGFGGRYTYIVGGVVVVSGFDLHRQLLLDESCLRIPSPLLMYLLEYFF